MNNYDRVLAAVKQVDLESRTWRSKDGETLDKLHERRIVMAAARLTEILFPEANDEPHSGSNLIDQKARTKI